MITDQVLKNHVDKIKKIAGKYNFDRSRLLSILQDAQRIEGFISNDSINAIATALNIHRVEVEDTLSFYSFFRTKPGTVATIWISKCPMCGTPGGDDVARAFERELGITIGETTPDGKIILKWTNCIGMCDQGPAVLVNERVFTNLDADEVKRIVSDLRKNPFKFNDFSGFSQFKSVKSSLVKAGPLLQPPFKKGIGLWSALSKSPDEVIDEIAKSGLRGRGGAGFPTGAKWRLAKNSKHGVSRYVFCNADEGEPGTFKDRMLLTECPDLVFEGLTIAGYALGAKEGIIYLRGEYSYMLDHLKKTLETRRKIGLLGDNICGDENFSFDIRIQPGAGAYICGEETALIESTEGKRGAPRDRPPYPTDQGYFKEPTVVNNVETLANAARLLEYGTDWFTCSGTPGSPGTKLMSVAGDCKFPGVYEVDFGITLNDLLDMVGGEDAFAVQVGGASGQCVAPKDYGRQLSYEDLSTGGSTMVFGANRDILQIMGNFLEFFEEESCGWCAPCRIGTKLMKIEFDRILDNRGTRDDLKNLLSLCNTIKIMSRCGLGQSAPNPILSTFRNFCDLYNEKIQPDDFIPKFNLNDALKDARDLKEESLRREEMIFR